MWGVYDTLDKLWIGNDDGPVSYDDQTIARAAAQIIEDMTTGTDLGGRFVARAIPANTFRLRDEIAARHTATESIRRIERQ